LKQKVALTFKDTIKLDDNARTSLANMQKEIANSVIESKLTSDNKLDALPQSAKDILSRDESVNNSCSSTSIDEKVQSSKVSTEAGASIIIESIGSIDAKGLVIDQDVMATVITDFLANDAIESGLTIASEIEDKFERQTGMSISSERESEIEKIKALGEANKGAITAGQSGVNAAAANQVAVDAGKMLSGIAEVNKSVGEIVKDQGEAASGVTTALGDSVSGNATAAAEGNTSMVNANRADDYSWIGYIFLGLGVLALIGLATKVYINKKRSAKKSTDTTS
jgi:hypothetical protein